MLQSLKYAFWLLLCIGVATALSYMAFYAFWFSARWFHSVPVARACDTAGWVFLTPARLVYAAFGGTVDQSVPLADPLGYATANGIVIGVVLYSWLRRALRAKAT